MGRVCRVPARPRNVTQGAALAAGTARCLRDANRREVVMSTDIPEFGQVVPSAFQRDHEGVGGATASRALVEILDLQEQQPAVIRLRDWAMAVAQPRPGHVVVDVGSGTGTETRRLALAVGSRGR